MYSYKFCLIFSLGFENNRSIWCKICCNVLKETWIIAGNFTLLFIILQFENILQICYNRYFFTSLRFLPLMKFKINTCVVPHYKSKTRWEDSFSCFLAMSYLVSFSTLDQKFLRGWGGLFIINIIVFIIQISTMYSWYFSLRW